MTIDTSAMTAWVSVNRHALQHNLEAIRAFLADEQPPRLIAVVKANAYGHGAVETSRTLQALGIDLFAVTTIDEAQELRDAGLAADILVMTPPLPGQIDLVFAHRLTASVGDEKLLTLLAQRAEALDCIAPVHLKVDTGMGRLGALPDQALLLAHRIAAEQSLRFDGIYTHFARALEPDPTPTRKQFARFEQLLARLHTEGIDCGMRHCANSAALIRFPEMRLDAVRAGTILYGQYPSAAVPRVLDLQETWTLQARVIAVRDVPQGTAIGYGGECSTRRASRIAVLPIGYADGFTVAPASVTQGWRGVKALLRSLAGASSPFVTIRDRKAPVLGRVAMQLCTVDVTDIPGVAVGDIAAVPARRLLTSSRLPRIWEG